MADFSTKPARLSADTHPSPRASFPPPIPPPPSSSPLPLLIKGHLLGFLSAFPLHLWLVDLCRSLIGQSSQDLPLLTIMKTSPPTLDETPSLSEDGPLSTLRLFLAAPPSLQSETRSLRVSPGGWHVSHCASCFLQNRATVHWTQHKHKINVPNKRS